MNDVNVLDRWRNSSTLEFIPMQASLELTYRCNERCTHCYIEKFEDDQKRILTQEEWFQVLDRLRSAGTLYLILMGGEAMLNPNFWEIAKRSSELGFHTSMITNGLKIRSLEIAQKLKDHGIHIITFSFYSLDPKVHDRMTQVPGSQVKTLQAIEWCREAGLEVSVNCLFTNENAHTVFDLYDWCTERNIEMKVDATITPKLNGDISPTKFRATEDQIRWFYRERSKRWINSVPAPSLDKETDYVCNAAKGKCAVNPYGELLPCIEIRETLGNLVKDDFKTIWNSPTAEKWRSLLIKDLKETGGMEVYSHCDHCPGMAKNEHGDPLKVTCFSRKMAEIKLEVANEFKNP